jgi:hypothetical protein
MISSRPRYRVPRRVAIEIAIDRQDWDMALHHAYALEAYFEAEPLPFTDFIIARARAFAERAQNPSSARAERRLEELHRQGESVGWVLRW